MKIIVGILVFLSAVIFLTYGTLNPCGILKKEIATQAKKQGNEEHAIYLLFGGFFDRSIDILSPIQCVQKIYDVKIHGYTNALDDVSR